MSLSQSPSAHTLFFSVLSRVRQGVVWLHRARGSSKESSSSVALQGRGHRTLGWAGLDLWIFWSELVLDQEGSELKSRGLVARLGVDMNLRLSCNLGCFYGMRKGPHRWAMRTNLGLCLMLCWSWCCLNNGVYKDFPINVCHCVMFLSLQKDSHLMI